MAENCEEIFQKIINFLDFELRKKNIFLQQLKILWQSSIRMLKNETFYWYFEDFKTFIGENFFSVSFTNEFHILPWYKNKLCFC